MSLDKSKNFNGYRISHVSIFATDWAGVENRAEPKMPVLALQLMHDIGDYLKTGDEGAFKIFLSSS